MKKIKFGNKILGHRNPVSIVFEAGPTHDGLETAKKLVDVASASGADAIKFQIVDSKKIVRDREVMFTYTTLIDKAANYTEEVTESLLEILERRELSYNEWEDLIQYCRKRNIEFFSTVSNIEELEFLHSQKVKMIKICSGDINYNYFLKKAAAYDWIIQIDTGAASIGEIEKAINILENSGCEKIVINHCPSGYPARMQNINLRIVQTLLKMFEYPIAFSDHSTGFNMDIAAVALGVNMVEKTITTDRTIRSPEHIMSLEPHDVKAFVAVIREVEMALGNTRLTVSKEVDSNKHVARRSLFAAADLMKGTVLSQAMIDYLRPGTGIPADMDYYFIGRPLRCNIQKGAMLKLEHFD